MQPTLRSTPPIQDFSFLDAHLFYLNNNYSCSVLHQNIYTEQPPVRQFPWNTKYSIIRSKIIVSFEDVLLFKGNPAGWHGPNREETMAGEYVTRLLTFDPELTSWHYNTFVLCIAGAGVSAETQEQISGQRGEL